MKTKEEFLSEWQDEDRDDGMRVVATKVREIIERLFDQNPFEAPEIRLRASLEAVAAELHLVQASVPPAHCFQTRIHKLFGFMSGVARKRRCGSVRGLKLADSFDWAVVAKSARNRVERFDRDVQTGVIARPTRLSNARATTLRAVPARECVILELPALQERSATGPILILGGVPDGRVLEALRQTTKLPVEWPLAGGDNPRADGSPKARLKAGRIGALILLTGLVSHPFSKAIIDAAGTGRVPHVACFHPGMGQLRSALMTLEARLTVRPAGDHGAGVLAS